MDDIAILRSLAAPPPFFHDVLRGRRWPARVASVHDGDTMQVVILYLGAPIRLSCRMLGYDSPELNSKDPMRRELAKQATRVLKDAVIDGDVTVEFHGKEKYGRMLARVFRLCDGVCVNDQVMHHAFNVRYSGGARPPA